MPSSEESIYTYIYTACEKSYTPSKCIIAQTEKNVS